MMKSDALLREAIYVRSSDNIVAVTPDLKGA
jgi:hypothetical protein